MVDAKSQSASDEPLPQSPEVLVQATGWRRNTQGKIELFAEPSPMNVQPSLTCAAVPKS